MQASAFPRLWTCLVLALFLLVSAAVPVAFGSGSPAPRSAHDVRSSARQPNQTRQVATAISCAPAAPPSIEPSLTLQTTSAATDLSMVVAGATPAPSVAPSALPSAPSSPLPSTAPTSAPSPSPSHAPPPAPRLGSPEIFGYLPNWGLSANVDYGAITTVAYFSVSAGADGHIVRYDNSRYTTQYSRWLGPKVTNAIAQAHANGDRFVLTVDGMAWDDAGKATVRALLTDPARRAVLVADIVKEIVSRNVDGVSLDFEPILSDQRDNFAALLNELRVGLDAVNPMYQLTFAATGSQVALTYEMIGKVTAAGAADAVIIMGYPLRSPDAKFAGGLAPYDSPRVYDLKQITNAYLKYTAPTNIVMALPWYGREWPTTTDAVNAPVQTDRSLYGRPNNISYANAVQVAQQYGRQLDPVEISAWTAYRTTAGPGCPETWQQVYYDDVDTINFKLDYLVSKGLAGFGFFALGYDGQLPELWKLLRVKYRGLSDTTPPTGALALDPNEAMCQTTSARLALSAADDAAGSGVVYVRISNQPDVGVDGVLGQGRTYPNSAGMVWPLDDPSLGGFAAPGPRTVYAQWRDVSGNWSVPVSTTFDVDQATAELTLGTAGDTNNAVASLLVSQTGGREIARVIASNDGALTNGVLARSVDVALGNPASFSLTDPATGGVDVDGAHAVYAQWQDTHGCWSAPTSAQVTLDRQAPAGTLTIADGAAASFDGNVQLLAPATDAHSGVSALELSNDGATWTDVAPSGDVFAWSAGATDDGIWTVSARWRDGAGNTSTVATVSLILDRSIPTGSVLLNDGAVYTSTTAINVQPSGTALVASIAKVVLSNSAETTEGVLSSGAAYAPSSSIPWTLSDSTDGVHTVYVQWQDSVGRWSAVVSASIILDRTAPVVSAPIAALALGAQLGSTSVPVDVAASATDALSGVTSIKFDVSRNGGAWTAIAQTALTPDGAIDRTATWQFRASATDTAGNSVTTTTGRSIRAVVTENSSSAITYTGTWRTSSNTAASGGSTRYATARGATATFTFSGSSVAWVAPRGFNLGRARVFIDGVGAGRPTLYGAAAQRIFVFVRTWAAPGTHTIRIKVLGTSGHPRIDVDAFTVLT